MLGSVRIGSAVTFALASVALGISTNACGNATGSEVTQARLTTVFSGPAASNVVVPAATVQVAAGILTVRAASVFPQGGYSLSATASISARRGMPAALQVIVKGKRPSIALDIAWLVIYDVEVSRIPAGSYDLTLVRVDDDRPQPRVELRQTVSVP